MLNFEIQVKLGIAQSLRYETEWVVINEMFSELYISNGWL